LRCFLDDITAWGWEQAPARRVVFGSGIPRQARLLPRALPADVDAALMEAISRHPDPLARAGLAIMRGTGLRIGELLDLELDCVIDYGTTGSWLRVPLGKLATERAVPLDDSTLACLDGLIRHRGPQRALPHPRLGRDADFVFIEAGRRVVPGRLRRALRQAAEDAGLTGTGGQPLRVVPHQLRHTYATTVSTPGYRCATCKKLLPMRTRGPRCATTEPAAAWTGTPPTSSPPTSRAPPDKRCRGFSVWRSPTPDGETPATRFICEAL